MAESSLDRTGPLNRISNDDDGLVVPLPISSEKIPDGETRGWVEGK